MKNIWEKYKEYILVLFYGILVFALFYFLVKPMIGRIDYNANLIQEKTTEQDSYRKKLEMSSLNKEQADSIEANEDKLNVLLPEDREVDLIERIEKIADDTGNKISIEALDDKNTPNAKSKKTTSKVNEQGGEELKINSGENDYVKFKITLSGKYNNLVNFIHKVENMEYWSDILSIQVSYKEPEVISESSESEVGIEESSEPVKIDDSDTSSVLEVIFYLNK